MQKFTPKQMQLINNERSKFNQEQRIMAARMGGNSLIGCAAPIPKDSWGEWDLNGIEVARSTLAVFNDIASTNSKAMDLAVLVDHFQRISDSGTSNVTIDGRGKAKMDQAVLDYVGTPLPIFDSTADWGWRQMLTMQRAGGNLQVATISNNQRRIAEDLEDMVINGLPSIKVGGDQIWGLTTHPQRNTRSTVNTLNGATGAQWKADVVATLILNRAANFRQPVTLYLNADDWFYAETTLYDVVLGPQTIASFIRQLPGINSIVAADSIAADTIIALVKERETVEMLNGMPMTSRPITRLNTEDDFKVKIMAAQALQLKYDYNDQMGLAVSS